MNKKYFLFLFLFVTAIAWGQTDGFPDAPTLIAEYEAVLQVDGGDYTPSNDATAEITKEASFSFPNYEISWISFNIDAYLAPCPWGPVWYGYGPIYPNWHGMGYLSISSDLSSGGELLCYFGSEGGTYYSALGDGASIAGNSFTVSVISLGFPCAPTINLTALKVYGTLINDPNDPPEEPPVEPQPTEEIGIQTWLDIKGNILPLFPEPKPQECPPAEWEMMTLRKKGILAPFAVADPVNVMSGNFALPEVDLKLKARDPIVLARIYNSLDPRVTPFGKGWSSPFFTRLTIATTSVTFINADGSGLTFPKVNGVYQAPENSDLKLITPDANGFWSIQHASGKEWFYNTDGQIVRMAKSCCGQGASNALSFEYDQAKRLIKVENSSGQAMNFQYSAENLIEQVTDSTGRIIAYTFDAQKQLTSMTNPIGQTTTYVYGPENMLTEIRKPGQENTLITYADNRVTSVADPQGRTSTFAWDPTTKVATVITPEGTSYAYKLADNGGLDNLSIAGDNQQIEKSLQASGSKIIGYTDANGQQRTCTYNDFGYVTSITDALGNTKHYEWDEATKKLLAETNELGHRKTYTWCARGNLMSETDFAGNATSYTYDSYNNRTTKTDARGSTTRYVYTDNGGHLTQVISPDGGVSSFTYDVRGNLTSSANPLGFVTSFEYDALDRLTKTTYPDGRWVQMVYDVRGNIVRRIDNLNRETAYTYDLSGKLLSTTRPDGTVSQNEFDIAGRKVKTVDALQRETHFSYDAFDQLTCITYPDQATERFSYDLAGNLISKTDERGFVTNFEYDPVGRMLATIDPLSSRWAAEFDAAGRKVADIDPLGHRTEYVHSPANQVVKVIAPDGTATNNEYDLVGNLLKTITPSGAQWSWQYDALNRQTQAIAPNGAVSKVMYDKLGQVVTEIDPLGRKMLYTYDSAGHKLTTTEPASGTWTNVYDSAGRLIATKNPLGAQTTFAYDLINRLISETDPLGQKTVFEYDNADRKIAKVDPLERRTITNFDVRDRVVSVIDPADREVSFGYDEGGNRVRLTDGEGRIWRWDYDPVARVVVETDPLAHKVQFSYDAVGNKITKTNARNQTIAYDFDTMNRLKKVTYSDGAVATFAYDLEGREISRFAPNCGVTKTWDALGNMTSEKFHPWNKGWQLTYDIKGNRIKAISPQNKTFRYSYDALDRLTVLNPPGSYDTVKYKFDKAGRLKRVKRQNVVTNYQVDAANQLLRIRHEKWQKIHKKTKKTLLALRKYKYDAAGNRILSKDESGKPTRYTFDASDWLTNVIYPDGLQVSYTYNGAGDRLTEMVGSKTTSYQYDQAGRMIAQGPESFIYDADGNLTEQSAGLQKTTYTWTPDNRLAETMSYIRQRIGHGRKARWLPFRRTTQETYSYLPEDWRRVKRVTNGISRVSLYDGADESHEFLEVPKFFRRTWRFGKFCWKPKLPELKLEREFYSGPSTDDMVSTVFFGRELQMLDDALGSTIALTNHSGNLLARMNYDPWGNLWWPRKQAYHTPPCQKNKLANFLDRFRGHILGKSQHDPWRLGYHFAKVLTPYLFTGRKFDTTTQTYFNRWRQYNPKAGRFLSSDPIGFNGGNNLYGYANQNPLTFTDPFGFDSVERGNDGKVYLVVNGQRIPLESEAEIEQAQIAVRIQEKQDARVALSQDESQFLFVSAELAKLWVMQKFIAFATGKCFALPAPNVTVMRVEGLPNTRIIIGKNGLVTIRGDQTLFLNFGSSTRAQEFFAKRISQGLPGAQLKSFDVPASFLNELKGAAVPESMARQFPGAPILVDVTKSANQFGLRPGQIDSLLESIIQGTGRAK